MEITWLYTGVTSLYRRVAPLYTEVISPLGRVTSLYSGVTYLYMEVTSPHAQATHLYSEVTRLYILPANQLCRLLGTPSG
jgi:hypothetical protein